MVFDESDSVSPYEILSMARGDMIGFTPEKGCRGKLTRRQTSVLPGFNWVGNTLVWVSRDTGAGSSAKG